jgi:hypothetical protein
MPVNAPHRDAYRTMQDVLNQTDNIRTESQTKLNDLGTVLEENKKNKKKGS